MSQGEIRRGQGDEELRMSWNASVSGGTRRRERGGEGGGWIFIYARRRSFGRPLTRSHEVHLTKLVREELHLDLVGRFYMSFSCSIILKASLFTHFDCSTHTFSLSLL